MDCILPVAAEAVHLKVVFHLITGWRDILLLVLRLVHCQMAWIALSCCSDHIYASNGGSIRNMHPDLGVIPCLVGIFAIGRGKLPRLVRHSRIFWGFKREQHITAPLLVSEAGTVDHYCVPYGRVGACNLVNIGHSRSVEGRPCYRNLLPVCKEHCIAFSLLGLHPEPPRFYVGRKLHRYLIVTPEKVVGEHQAAATDEHRAVVGLFPQRGILILAETEALYLKDITGIGYLGCY